MTTTTKKATKHTSAKKNATGAGEPQAQPDVTSTTDTKEELAATNGHIAVPAKEEDGPQFPVLAGPVGSNGSVPGQADSSDQKSGADESLASRQPEHQAAVETIRKALQVLVEPGQVVELRVVPDRKAGPPRAHLPVRSEFFDADHLTEMAKQAERWSAYYPHYQGVYFTLNPLNPDLLAPRQNRTGPSANVAASDEDVLRRRWLLVDVDPERPKHTSATNAEKAKAREAIDAIRESLRGRGWPEPILSDSGNGYHLLYRIDLPADDNELVKRVLHALAARFDTDAAKVDKRVFNPSRICKLPGTWAKETTSLTGRTGCLSCWKSRRNCGPFRRNCSKPWLATRLRSRLPHRSLAERSSPGCRRLTAQRLRQPPRARCPAGSGTAMSLAPTGSSYGRGARNTSTMFRAGRTVAAWSGAPTTMTTPPACMCPSARSAASSSRTSAPATPSTYSMPPT